MYTCFVVKHKCTQVTFVYKSLCCRDNFKALDFKHVMLSCGDQRSREKMELKVSNTFLYAYPHLHIDMRVLYYNVCGFLALNRKVGRSPVY